MMTFSDILALLNLIGGAIYATFMIVWHIINDKKK